MPKKRKQCFVIMPFSKTSTEHTEEYWTKHFETFLKPLIEQCAELEAHRSEPLRGDVLRKIITELVVSPVVVADLTDRNPNVFLELGVRQSFKHGTVTIAEKGTKIPFDISVKGILFYHPKDHIKNAKFINRFKEAVMDCLSHPESPDSLVLETISGRGTLFEIIHRDEAIRRVKALISEYTTNIAWLKHIYDIVQKNRKFPEKRKYATARLRSPAIELLITTRYLDEEDSFYSSAEECFSRIFAINEQLSVWESKPVSTEAWFWNPKVKVYQKELRLFKKELGRILKELTAS